MIDSKIDVCENNLAILTFLITVVKLFFMNSKFMKFYFMFDFKVLKLTNMSKLTPI